ncbi:MAG TPA: hypothetical protein VH206_11200 [Xanthobacteraceae bacterium]|jgi:hypothetical protein|nr:hypothetical protein [Xanthobacteraceae bacterium]
MLPNLDTRPKNVLSPTAVVRLWRALLVSDDRELKADEAASTLFRFFRSRHVIDLRLIVTLTMIISSIHLLVVLVFAVARIHHAAEGLSFVNLASRGIPLLGKYFAPAFAIYSGILAWAYLTAAKRLGVVDLFACEIGTLCRVGTVFDIGSLYAEKFEKAKQAAAGAQTHHIEHIAEKRAATGQLEHTETFVSKEEYFPVFAANSPDLQVLEERVVANITEFYTYMKASRDLMRRLVETDAVERPKVYIDLMYVLFLGYEAGRKSIKQLIEFEPTQAEEVVVVLLTELVCYKFLCHQFASNKEDVRNRRLTLRTDVYKDEVPKLYRKIAVDHGSNENDWLPAKETIDELGERYEAAFGEPIAAPSPELSRTNRAA